MVQTFLQDLRYALRMLRKNHMLALVIVVSLASAAPCLSYRHFANSGVRFDSCQMLPPLPGFLVCMTHETTAFV